MEQQNKKEPQKWIDRIRRTEKINKDKREECVRYKKAYLGEFLNRKGDDVSKYTVRVNFIYYFVETILSSVFQGEPKVMGRPKKDPRASASAELNAYNTNYWAKEINLKSELQDAVFDSFFGPAAIYTGWEFETTTEEAQDPITGEMIKQEKVLRDQPLARWLDFYNELRVDPDVLRTRRARWMAVRVTVPHSEFIETQTIKEEYRTGPKALKPTQRPEDLAQEADSGWRDDRRQIPSDAEWITYWEVWDREKMERKLVHESCPEDFLNKDTSWPFELEVKNDPFPVTILHAKQDPFGPLSVSEFKAIEDQIWERVRLRSVQAAIARRSAPKYLYQKGAGTKDMINKLLKSDILSANELNDMSKFTLMPAPEIPQGFYQWDVQLGEDLGNTSGLSEFQNNQIANTATEASIAEGRSTVRKSSRTARLEEFVVTVMTKISMLCQQLQERQVTFMINPENLLDGEPQVFNVTKNDIQAETEFDLVAGSMEHVNVEMMKRDLLKFLEIAAQSGESNNRAILAKIAEYLNLDPRQVLISSEEKQQMAEANKEPAIEFEKVKMEYLSPVDRLRVVEKAKEEAGVKNLSPGPAAAAQQQLQSLEATMAQQAPRTLMPDNQSFNKAGNMNPQAPVQDASLSSDR